MKQCPVCGREVVSKRKDAVFCKDSACRKKAHQERKEQAAKLPPQVTGNKASVVVEFPDGSRWLLELTPLQVSAQTNLPALTQVAAMISGINSGSDPPPSEARSPSAASSPPAITSAGSSSEQIPDAAFQQMPTPGTAPPAIAPFSRDPTPADIHSAPAAHATPAATEKREEPTALRTIELFFIDEQRLRLSFPDAVQRRTIGGWKVRRHARAQLGFSRLDGSGLGGAPGRWHDYYPQRSPSEFGLDVDLAVLYADTDTNEVCVADAELLREVLGNDWRERLRQAVSDYSRVSNRIPDR